MKVLFVGASGLVGRGVVPLLPNDLKLILAGREEDYFDGRKVLPLDICDFEATKAFVREHSPDAVVNCAIADYRSQRTGGSAEIVHRYNERTIEVNVRGAYHLYEAATLAGVRKFVFISSLTTLTGSPAYESIRGDEHPRPINFYACTKLFGEQLGQTYAADGHLSVTCLRLGQPFPLPSGGGERWLQDPRTRACLLHKEDIAQAIDLGLRHTAQFSIFPIVSGGETSWVDASAVAELGYSPRFRFTENGVEPR